MKFCFPKIYFKKNVIQASKLKCFFFELTVYYVCTEESFDTNFDMGYEGVGGLNHKVSVIPWCLWVYNEKYANILKRHFLHPLFIAVSNKKDEIIPSGRFYGYIKWIELQYNADQIQFNLSQM